MSKKALGNYHLSLCDLHPNTEKANSVLSGNVYADKPWAVHYKTNAKKIEIEDTLYNTFKKYAYNHLSDKAIFLPDENRTYTYAEVLELADSTAAAFTKIGLKYGSRIAGMFNSTIEEPVALLAANKIGALIFFVDYSKTPDFIKDTVEKSDFDILIMDEILLPLEPFINQKKIKSIICNAKNNLSESHHLSFQQLLNIGINTEYTATEYSRHKKSIVIYSSGTTGLPKPILHTDFSINSAAQKIFYSNYPLNDNTILLKTIPSFIGLGLITSLYTGLISGTTVALVKGGTDPKDLIDSTVSFLENYNTILQKNSFSKNTDLVIFSAPVFYRAVLYSEKIKDLSFVKGMLAAGSKMDKEELEKMDSILKQRGCSCHICNGYGQNEMAGAITLNDNKSNVKGSAGYPTIGTDVAIVHPQTLEYLGLNYTGKIIERSISSFEEYLNMPEQTESSKIFLTDGSCWFDTNDLGYMSEDYHLFITGRTSRVFIRMDHKIPLDNIENKLRKFKHINDCAIMVTFQESSYEKITAYIELKNKGEFDNASLNRIIRENTSLSELEYPDDIVLVDKIPYLGSGKVDYQKLKNSI